MSGNFKNTRTKSVLDLPKLRLVGEVQGGSRSRPTLSMYIIGENPRIDVYTQIEGDRDNGLIRAKLDYQALGLIQQGIRHFASPDTPAGRWALECKDSYAYGKKQPEPITTSTVIIGRDERGRVYMSVLDALNKERAKIRFYFGPGEYFAISNESAQPVDEGLLSQLMARGYVEIQQAIMGQPAQQFYEAEQIKKAQKDAQGGGNSGGYGNRGGNNGGGGGRAPAVEIDDDLGW